MKAAGIIAEFNPLHNGHRYLIEQASEIAGGGAVVIAMSGGFVQRGEPAIFDKWSRTRAALECGADLVVEIPALFCLGNAGQYARAGVSILEALGPVSHIVFGSESGDIEALKRTASVLECNSEAVNSFIREAAGSGMSYPAARQAAYERVRRSCMPSDVTEEMLADELAVLSQPNDILALEYVMAHGRAEMAAVRRIGAGHHDGADPAGRYQSASALRSMILSGESIDPYVPPEAAGVYSGCEEHMYLQDNDKLMDLLRYAILSWSPDRIDDCPSGGEGLGNLLRKSVAEAGTLDELIQRVKSRRYTYTRISRLCMQVLLGITRSEYSCGLPGYIRVLGFNDKGREVLAASGSDSLPLITNIGRNSGALSHEAMKLLELDVHASDVYNIITGRDFYYCSDYRMRPVILDSNGGAY